MVPPSGPSEGRGLSPRGSGGGYLASNPPHQKASRKREGKEKDRKRKRKRRKRKEKGKEKKGTFGSSTERES